MVIFNIIAWPIGYYFLHQWLQGDAYRRAFGIEFFVLAALGSLLIALLAVGLNTVKAACQDVRLYFLEFNRPLARTSECALSWIFG